jgi:O-antigen ligase
VNAVVSPTLESRYSDGRLELTEAPQRLSPLLCGIIPLLFFAVLSFGAVELWSISLLEIGSALLFLAWAAGQLVCGKIRIQSSPLYAPVTLFSVVVILQLGLNLTAYRYATLIASVEYLAYGMLLFLAIQSLANAQCSKTILWALTVFGFALALFAISQDLTSNGKIYWLRTLRHGGAIFGPYVNRDHYAGLMEMLSPIPIVLSLSALIRGPKRILVGFAGVVMAGSIVLSQSRAGTASFLVEMALLLGLLLGKRKNGRIAAGAVAVCLTAMAFAAWVGTAALWQRFTNLQDWMRLAIAKDGLRMFWQKPVLGWGLGTFTTVHPQFRSFYTNLFVNAAHNDYVQALTETGIVGFTAILWFVVAVYRAGLRNLESWGRSWSRTLGLAALIGCTGILVHSAFDFNLQIAANACVFYFLCAVATSTASLPEPTSSQLSRTRRQSSGADAARFSPMW